MPALRSTKALLRPLRLRRQSKPPRLLPKRTEKARAVALTTEGIAVVSGLTTLTSSPSTKRVPVTGRLKRYIPGAIFVAPAVVLFFMFVAYPLVRGVYLSFFRWAGYGNPVFIGARNYQSLLEDPIFRRALVVTLSYTVVASVLQTVVPMFIAILLMQRWRGGTIFRTLIFVPAVVSLTITGLLWQLALQPDGGIVNQMLGDIGLRSLQGQWLASTTAVVPVIILVSLWQSLGFYMLIFYAGLQNIDPALYESGRMDGANAWQLVRYVTIPLLRPVTVIVVTLNIINGLKVFDLIFAMTSGGPGHASESLGTYLYGLAFGSANGATAAFGYANAIGVVIMVGAAAAMLFQARFRAGRAQ